MSDRRTAIPAVLLVTVVLLGSCARKQPPAAPRVPVTVARVETRAVPWELDANGTVEPVRSVAVISRVEGVVTAVRFREGQEVDAGQALFQIDPRPLEAALARARADLRRDQVEAASARREADRYRVLADSGFATQEDFQQKEATADALDAAVRADSAEVAIAELDLEYATVRAPVAGRTGRLLVHEGTLVSASGDSMVTIVQLRPIDIRFAVAARELAAIRARGGAPLRVVAHAGHGPSGAIEGTLHFIDNQVTPGTGTVMLKARFGNEDGGLWPGEFVPVTLILDIEENATVVPARAVMTGQRGSYVFVVTPEGKTRMQPVDVARTLDTLAVIADGIEPGLEVVTDGQLRLTPNSTVEIRGAGPRGS